jgi:hypothetical protein
MSAIPRTGCSAVKHVSIARPATSDEENLPGCSGSSCLAIAQDLPVMSDTVPAGLRVRAAGWFPADGDAARLGVGKSTSIARAARRLLDSGRPHGPEPRGVPRPCRGLGADLPCPDDLGALGLAFAAARHCVSIFVAWCVWVDKVAPFGTKVAPFVTKNVPKGHNQPCRAVARERPAGLCGALAVDGSPQTQDWEQ